MNVAQSAEYKKRWEECKLLFAAGNDTAHEDCQLSERYRLDISRYKGKVGEWNLHGAKCVLVDNSTVVASWCCIDDDADFFKLITHSNGKQYLIFRQDLYGYSVLDIHEGEIMQFFPEASLNGETFIWTDVQYNALTNMLAVIGCYWACPNSVHLFTFDEPMSEQQKFIDLIDCFDGGYDIYDDVDFEKWECSDLYITSYNYESKSNEKKVICEDEYLSWIYEKGQKL